MKFATFILTLSSIADIAKAHGFLKSPRSRNYYASVEGADWGGSPGQPLKEYCPHCLNKKNIDQVCSTGQAQNYDTWTDTTGKPIPWLSQGVYTEGQEIIIEATLTTNHAGHFDIYICPDGSKSDQACFLENPLTLLEDMLHGGPVDDHYPERAYVSPATDFKFRYRLPMGIYGSEVMLQWRYVTANSCFPPGYVSARICQYFVVLHIFVFFNFNHYLKNFFIYSNQRNEKSLDFVRGDGYGPLEWGIVTGL